MPMDIRLRDKVEMKKPHPCGEKIFEITRVGMDVKLRCTGCGHEVMLPRAKAEKGIKKILEREETADEYENARDGAHSGGRDDRLAAREHGHSVSCIMRIECRAVRTFCADGPVSSFFRVRAVVC